MSISALILPNYVFAPAQAAFATAYAIPVEATIDLVNSSASVVTLRIYKSQADCAAADTPLANIAIPVPASAYSGADPVTSALTFLLAQGAAAHAAGQPCAFPDSSGSSVDLTAATAVSP